MAQIRTDTLQVKMSKLFKNGEEKPVLSTDQIAALTEVIEQAISELLDDNSIVVEVESIEF